MMDFEELDEMTRLSMSSEFEAERRGPSPYRSHALTAVGVVAFDEAMQVAMTSGNEATLAASLLTAEYWNPEEEYIRNGVLRTRRVNVGHAAGRLALTEFNTWYVRGLAARLMSEGVELCQAYRAAQPKWESADCCAHEGQVLAVRDVYAGHRARYWPPPGDPMRVSIPFGPSCHHTIRRWTPE